MQDTTITWMEIVLRGLNLAAVLNVKANPSTSGCVQGGVELFFYACSAQGSLPCALQTRLAASHFSVRLLRIPSLFQSLCLL